jgi:hypothetical protein
MVVGEKVPLVERTAHFRMIGARMRRRNAGMGVFLALLVAVAGCGYSEQSRAWAHSHGRLIVGSLVPQGGFTLVEDEVREGVDTDWFYSARYVSSYADVDVVGALVTSGFAGGWRLLTWTCSDDRTSCTFARAESRILLDVKQVRAECADLPAPCSVFEAVTFFDID